MAGSWALPWVWGPRWPGSHREAARAPCLSFPTWELGWGCEAGPVGAVVWRGHCHTGSVLAWKPDTRGTADLGSRLGPQDVFFL